MNNYIIKKLNKQPMEVLKMVYDKFNSHSGIKAIPVSPVGRGGWGLKCCLPFFSVSINSGLRFTLNVHSIHSIRLEDLSSLKTEAFKPNIYL